jgi:diguanylate cyclase (GGDEF)-like protein
MQKWFVFTLILFCTTVNAQTDTKHSEFWFQDEFSAPRHIFDDLNYQSSKYTFEDISFLMSNPQGGNRFGLTQNQPSLVGGKFLFIQIVSVDKTDEFVLDFSVSSYIANFWHSVYDESGKLVATFEGGTNSSQANPYYVRHGRNIELTPGRYTIASEFVSPFFIGPPKPVLVERTSYEKEVKITNLVAGLGLGIFLGLGVYYIVMSVIRRSATDLVYAGFIISNLVFNLASLLVLSDVFDVRWHFWGYITIAFSNILYVIFVMRLLNIRINTNRYLFRLGQLVCAIHAILLLDVVLFRTEMGNFNNRAGVLLFAGYGLIAAITKSFKSSEKTTARLYLLANIGFLGPAFMATVAPHMWSLNTTYAAHWGIMAVAIEVILLSFLLSYQLNRVHVERDEALKSSEEALKQARTDELTQIGNRFSLLEHLKIRKDDYAITFIDLDSLKRYNDDYGHAMGDELLKSFAMIVVQGMSKTMSAYRIAGDEFVLVCKASESDKIPALLEDVIVKLNGVGFENANVSYGIAFEHEAESIDKLIRLADLRMYDHKREKYKLSYN